MQRLLIEVTHEEQIFVENECLTKGFTISTFFKSLLEKYREGLIVEKSPIDEEPEKTKKRKKRKD